MRKPRSVEQRVKIGEETEMKRRWKHAVCEEVSEELARGKTIWNSTWLDSRRPGLVRSRLGENRIGGACKCENILPRNDGGRCVSSTVQEHSRGQEYLRAMHGTLVASSRWRRLA